MTTCNGNKIDLRLDILLDGKGVEHFCSTTEPGIRLFVDERSRILRISISLSKLNLSLSGDSLPPGRSRTSDYWEPYSYFTKLLRTWFVAYGIAMPSLLATQETFAGAIFESGDPAAVVGCFLGGVAIQVLVALVNKVTQWYLYCGENDHAVRLKLQYKLADRISEQNWLDILADIASAGLLGFGTYLALLSMIRHVGQYQFT